jgi:hypothetical protein
MRTTENETGFFSLLQTDPQLGMLFEDLRAGLLLYFKTAREILEQTGIRVKMPDAMAFSFDRHFFSFLFMYSFCRGGIPQSRRLLYAGVLQCLRGMVTGCDNLMDDEYKPTLDTNIPETAIRFRSVIDIMVSDRVLFHILSTAGPREGFSVEQVLDACAASIKTMTESGMQEASEEGGITQILQPNAILETVHHYKTGLLFTCPWDVPRIFENPDNEYLDPLLDGLYRIGMGCQIMDDMVDLAQDLNQKRHNYLVSRIFHGKNASESRRIRDLLAAPGLHPAVMDLVRDFPRNLSDASVVARRFLEEGFSRLLSPEHRFLVAPAIRFLENRLGVSGMFERLGHEI